MATAEGDIRPSLRCPISVGVEAAQCLVDIYLAASDLLHQFDPRRRGRCWCAVDADLDQQRVETRSGRWVADTQMPLELFHVPARREENSQYVAVLIGQHAKLACRKATREL